MLYQPWRPYLQADETANDSDKTFTVPAETEWQILWIWVELTTTDDAGNRQLVIEIEDLVADVTGQVRVGVVQPVSVTRYYMFGPSLPDLAAFRDTDFLMTPIPQTIFLKAGDSIRVYDNAAIAATADDMIVQMQVLARSIV